MIQLQLLRCMMETPFGFVALAFPRTRLDTTETQ